MLGESSQSVVQAWLWKEAVVVGEEGGGAAPGVGRVESDWWSSVRETPNWLSSW